MFRMRVSSTSRMNVVGWIRLIRVIARRWVWLIFLITTSFSYNFPYILFLLLLESESYDEESDESDGGGSGSDFTFDSCFSHFGVEIGSDRVIISSIVSCFSIFVFCSTIRVVVSLIKSYLSSIFPALYFPAQFSLALYFFALMF